MKKGDAHPRPGRLGMARRPGRHPGAGSRRDRDDHRRQGQAARELHRDGVPGAEGNFVFNASQLLVGRRLERAAGVHAADGLHDPEGAGPAGAADHRERAGADAEDVDESHPPMTHHQLSRREMLRAAASAGVAVAARTASAQDQAVRFAARRCRAGSSTTSTATTAASTATCRRTRCGTCWTGWTSFPRGRSRSRSSRTPGRRSPRAIPQSVERLKRFLADATPAARVEIVSGAYGQAYAWNAQRREQHPPDRLRAGGAARGVPRPRRGHVRRSGAVLDELPAAVAQVVRVPPGGAEELDVLGRVSRRRCSTRTWSTGSGRTAPRIVAVPQYAIEGLVPPATTLGSQPTAAFIDRCVAAGIEHPAGTTLQDMGWPGRPWRFGMEPEVVRAMQHVTWREYVDTIASPPVKEWKASQEDLRVGASVGRVGPAADCAGGPGGRERARAGGEAGVDGVRAAGHAVPARGAGGSVEALLWSQHHDVWIVSYNRHKDGTWASAVDEKCESIAAHVRADRRVAPAASMAERPEGNEGERSVRVFNTTGFRRRDLASVEIAGAENGHGVRCGGRGSPLAGDRGGAGARRPRDARVSGRSARRWATRRIGSRRAARSKSRAKDGVGQGGDESRTEPSSWRPTCIAISIDPAKGGRISSLFAKDLDREFVDQASRAVVQRVQGLLPRRRQVADERRRPGRSAGR